jgi:hypothetical protein|tara:strand:- start:18119 stop:18520 length:402 start_codon:yes stop_codon:yes gene_type:complete
MRIFATACLLFLTSCGSTTYPGIDLSGRPASEEAFEIQQLALRAELGDKGAQLELGQRYETGDGVLCDVKVARRLYEQAATNSGGRQQVYSPPVGDVPGQMMVVDIGREQNGLPEAQARLKALRWRCAAEPAV